MDFDKLAPQKFNKFSSIDMENDDILLSNQIINNILNETYSFSHGANHY